jgi:hypothetical protein
MSYQSINNNPFQQSQSPNPEDSENDEEAAHNIKFTIPPNSNEKGSKIANRMRPQGYLFLGSLSPLQLSGTTLWISTRSFDASTSTIRKADSK